MSDEPSQTSTHDEADAQQEAQPDDSEPSPERQAELRAAYGANVAAGKAPYENVDIRTLRELSWVMRERGWSGDEILVVNQERANLSGATLHANLSETD